MTLTYSSEWSKYLRVVFAEAMTITLVLIRSKILILASEECK